MQTVKPEKVIVNLISSDGSKEVFTRCLPSITVSDLKAKWRQEHGPRREDILLKTVDGAVPADDLPLNRFQDCSNPSQVIELTVVSGQGVLVLHNQDSHKLAASVISKTPRQITLQIRNLFRFPSKQVFRLRSGDRVLANDLSLNDQGVGPGCQVFVDKQIVLPVKDLWNDGQELQLEVFESQTLSEVIPQPWQEFLEKLMFLSEYGDRITPDTSIKDFLEKNPQLKLQVDRIDEIHFLIDHQLSCPSLSSTDQPRTVLPYRFGPREVMVGEDRRLIPTASPLGRLRKHRVDGNAVLHVDPLRVMYREGEKKTARFKVLRFPRGSLSADFRQNRIVSGRTAARLETLVDGEGKDLEAKEGPLGALKDGARVQLKPSQPKHHSIRVYTGNLTLEWTEHRPVITFSELSGQVALMSKASPLEVMRRAFRCVGCSRKICLEEEEFQLIPAPCCRERSLVLLEVKDKAMQTRRPQMVHKEVGTQSSESFAKVEGEVATMKDRIVEGAPTEAQPKPAGQHRHVIAEQESEPPQFRNANTGLIQKTTRERHQPLDDMSSSETGVYGYADLSSLSPDANSASTGRQFFGDNAEVEVLLKLPTDEARIPQVLKVDNTLKSVIDDIYRDRAFFPVNDIIVSGRRLSIEENWRKKTVGECKIRNRDKVDIEVGRPDSVTVLTMHVDGFHDRENIPLELSEWSWGILWSRINFFFDTDGKMPVVFISMTFVDRLGKPQQRGVRGGNLLHGIVANYDEETGKEISEEGGRDVATTFGNEFLCPTSGFRAPPQCSPILHIHPKCDVLCLPRPDAPITEVCESVDDALFDVNSVALIWGLRSRYGRSERWQLYLEHGDGTICNVEHGNTFEDASSLPSAGNDVKRVIFLLRNNDIIPQCRISPNTPVKVWTRNNLHYSMEGRRIKVKESNKTFDAMWTLTRSVGSFQRSFTEIMGRRSD